MKRRDFISFAVVGAGMAVLAPKLLGQSRDVHVYLKANETLANRSFKNQTVYVTFEGNGGTVDRCYFDNANGPDVALSLAFAEGVDPETCMISNCTLRGNGHGSVFEPR